MRHLALAFALVSALAGVAAPGTARDAGVGFSGHLPDYVLDAAPLSEAVAVVPPGILRLDRTPGHPAGHRTARLPAAAPPTSPESASAAARGRWRMLDRASLDFTARLAFSLHGSLSSHSTACPPPA